MVTLERVDLYEDDSLVHPDQRLHIPFRRRWHFIAQQMDEPRARRRRM